MTFEGAIQRAEDLLTEAALQADLERMRLLNGLADSWISIAHQLRERENV